MYADDTKNKRRCTRDFCQIVEGVYRAYILGRNGVSFIGKMKFHDINAFAGFRRPALG